MCPQASQMNEYWTDEGIFMSLLNFKNGSPLPSNVTSDVNPYQYKPSDLPVDFWYFCSGVKKDAGCGFWLEKGDASEIFSYSTILGLRTTLQFYEGQTPHGKKTDWMMQEYTIHDKRNIKVKDHRALCRVFLADKSKTSPGHCTANINIKISVNLEPTRTSNNVFTNELLASQEKITDKTVPSLMTKSDLFLENSAKLDCILQGDYFELNDLIDPGSQSSSSANSSCLTLTSEEYFDSMALLQELDDVVMDQKMKESSVKFNLSAPVKSKEIVICSDTIVPFENDKEYIRCAQETSKVENNRSTSNGFNAASSSSSVRPSREDRKERVGRTKRLKMMKFMTVI